MGSSMNAKFMMLTALVVGYSSVSQGAQANKELCFEAVSSVYGEKTTQNLTYGEIKNGHVNFFGKGCYTTKTGGMDCVPVSGSGILHDDELEANIQAVEFEDYGSGEELSENVIHLVMNLDTLKGFYAASVSVFKEGQEAPIEAFDKGIATAVACPPVSKEELALDKKLKKAIQKMDKL